MLGLWSSQGPESAEDVSASAGVDEWQAGGEFFQTSLISNTGTTIRYNRNGHEGRDWNSGLQDKF